MSWTNDFSLAVGELAPAHSVPPRALEQRIVDVGDVLHVADANAEASAKRTSTSNAQKVKAWPMCPESYGVTPHT